MSNRHEIEGRTIHASALKELGEEACIVALGVARDLRNGMIPPEEFNMRSVCKSACCIAGWMTLRLGVEDHDARLRWYELRSVSSSLHRLFLASNPSNPILAADAIERYVYDGSESPWTPT